MKKILTLTLALSSCLLFAQKIKFGSVSKEALEEKFYPTDSVTNAAYLLKERKTSYNYSNGFTLVTEIHERIKIYNKNGYDKANIEIGMYKSKGMSENVGSIRGYTFNLENGNIVKEKLRSKNIFSEEKSKNITVKKLVFPNIKDGSIIDLRYKIISPFTISIDEVKFQYDIPIKKYFTSIKIPEFYTFKENFKGFHLIRPKKEVLNSSLTHTSKSRSGFGLSKTTTTNTKIDYKIFKTTYSSSNIPALRDDEPYVGNISNYRGGIKYELSYIKYPNDVPKYYTTTWEDVSKKIHKFSNFGTQLKKTAYFKDDLQNIIANTTNSYEKITAIFNFVKSKVKWNENYGKYTDRGVKKAYKEGVGNVADINLMLTAMLREAGLEANPVLVSSRNNGIPLFPTMNGFNYVISMVEFTDGKYFVLDATEPYSPPNTLPLRALNWKGRKVTKTGESSWVNISPTKHASEDHKLFVKINADTTIEGKLKSTHTNLNAMNQRIKNNHRTNEEQISFLEENYEIEIDDFKIDNKNAIDKPISKTLQFTSDNLVEEINGKLYIKPLLFLTTNENPFKNEERKFPVDFLAKWKDRFLVSITIPEGYKIEALPEAIAIGLPDNLGTFRYKTSIKGNKVQTLCTIQFNYAKISPQYYTSLKKFYGQMVDKQNEKVILVKE